MVTVQNFPLSTQNNNGNTRKKHYVQLCKIKTELFCHFWSTGCRCKLEKIGCLADNLLDPCDPLENRWWKVGQHTNYDSPEMAALSAGLNKHTREARPFRLRAACAHPTRLSHEVTLFSHSQINGWLGGSRKFLTPWIVNTWRTSAYHRVSVSKANKNLREHIYSN